MAQEGSASWSPSVQPESVSQNRSKAMRSNLFDEAPQQRSYRPPQTQFMGPQVTQYSPQQQNKVADISGFPEFSLQLEKLDDKFDLGVTKRSRIVSNRSTRRMNFSAGEQMKQMRAELERDFSSFSERMKKLTTNQPLKLEPVVFEPIAKKPVVRKEVEKIGVSDAEDYYKRTAEYEPPNAQRPVQPDEQPGFSTASEFILPDGSVYVSNE